MGDHDFPELKNDRILKVIQGEVPDRIPVWIMRQAGRYLPEFQEMRAKHSFFEICQTPELACEVTLMPLRRFKLDAAIIFSDILVIPQALGMTVEMKPGVGPVLPEPLTLDGIKNLNHKNTNERLDYVAKAITLTRHKLSGLVPLIGFSGAPWTLMGYMIEGGGSKTMSKAKKWLYEHPDESKELLSILTFVIVDYLVMQVEAGAQLLQVFESSGEYLNKELFEKFCMPFLWKIRQGLKAELHKRKITQVPVILFIKGGHYCLETQSQLNYEVLGIDWTVEPDVARLKTNNYCLQGNLDPCALYASKLKITELTLNMLKKFGYKNLIVNLGHGIYPDANPEHVEVFIEAVHSIDLHATA